MKKIFPKCGVQTSLEKVWLQPSGWWRNSLCCGPELVHSNRIEAGHMELPPSLPSWQPPSGVPGDLGCWAGHCKQEIPLGSGGQAGDVWLGIASWKMNATGWHCRYTAGDHMPRWSQDPSFSRVPPAPSLSKVNIMLAGKGEIIPVSKVSNGRFMWS